MSVKTSIATHDAKDITVRGKSLCGDLIGKVSFTEMTYFHVVGRMPTEGEAAVLDACLVTLTEHGLTPSVLASRLVASSAPEAMQSAIAAGLLAVGSVFVGTVEGAAALITRVAANGDEAAKIAAEHRAAKRPLPGFGHPEHRPDDPRPPCIFAVLDAHGLARRHVDALLLLGRAVDAEYGKHITINATGAVAAALLDIGVPAEIMRGFAVLARCAGLVGHVFEEMRTPAMRAIWDAAEKAVPYSPP